MHEPDDTEFTAATDADKPDFSPAGLEELLAYLHESRGFDFDIYKRTGLARRIGHRATSVGTSNYHEYLDYLQVHPDEFGNLFNSLLINATSFFRDPSAWEHLATVVVPRLMLSLLNTVLEDHALSAEIKGLQLSFATQVENARVVGDATRLQQVLNNLLGNALKFTPNGGAIRVELSCPGSAVEIRVIDSGRGMSADELPKVFAAFVQLGTRAGNPGLGLGLSIARHLVKLHGGTLTAHSAGPGRGAKFALRLPLAAQ
jgi:signal transduction histidine kinase